MVYVESLDAFVEQAEALYRASPLRTRYVLKYSHSKGKLTLRATDDRTTVQFKTDQQADLRKIDKLNSRFIYMMSTGQEPAEEEMAEVSQGQQPSQKHRKQPQQEQSSKSKKTRRKV